MSISVASGAETIWIRLLTLQQIAASSSAKTWLRNIIIRTLRKPARTDLSAVNWKALSNFKLAFEAAAELQTPSVQVLGDEDPDEGLGSSAESELFDED